MLDEIILTATGGRGGDGAVSLRREAYVPRGGPDGGDGGRGGSVVVQADSSLQGLDKLRRRKVVAGEAGQAGGPRKRHGRNGQDTVVQVPPGTLVWRGGDEETLVADLASPGSRVVVARGGVGGKGNARLATARRRVPRIAEKGLPGETVRMRLELRLLAEVGLVGLPNAGKTSLLRAISEARPKVGAYPFTTLEPNLGMAEAKYETVLVADIPGLIEGAHEGAGLGVAFLQHVRRTRMLVHVVDATGPDPLEDIETVRTELEAFGHGLAAKLWIVALNKSDLVERARMMDAVAKVRRRTGHDVYSVSARTGDGTDLLLRALVERVREERAAEAAAAQPAEVLVVPPVLRQPIEVTREGRRFDVRGEPAARVIAKLGVASEEARAEVARRLRRLGVLTSLRRAGVEAGDVIRIGEAELQWPL